MINWVELKHGSVTFKHHSTSNTVELNVVEDEEVAPGKWEKVTKKYWFDYEAFDDLRAALEKIN